MILEILNNVDTKYLYIAVGILVILMVIAIVKKLLKVGILILILTVGTSTLIPIVNDFKNNYGFTIGEDTVTVMIKGEEMEIDKTMLSNIEFKKEADGSYSVNIGGETQLVLPKAIVGMVDSYAEKNGIQLKITE